MTAKLWKEDIETLYSQLWSYNKTIPSIEGIVNSVLKEKEGELLLDLMYLYKSRGDIDNLERIERGEIIDKDFFTLGFDFGSLRLNIIKTLEESNMVFVEGDKVMNSSKRLLFQYHQKGGKLCD